VVFGINALGIILNLLKPAVLIAPQISGAAKWYAMFAASAGFDLLVDMFS
jgi:hypothetical protein